MSGIDVGRTPLAVTVRSTAVITTVNLMLPSLVCTVCRFLTILVQMLGRGLLLWIELISMNGPLVPIRVRTSLLATILVLIVVVTALRVCIWPTVWTRPLRLRLILEFPSRLTFSDALHTPVLTLRAVRVPLLNRMLMHFVLISVDSVGDLFARMTVGLLI